MEKTNIVFIAQSLDGYIADKKGGLDWLQLVPNPEQNSMGFNETMSEIDALVMGKNTFETIQSFEGPWPYQKPVFILSNSLKATPSNLKNKIQILNGGLSEILSQIHTLGYFKLYIDGANTIQQFLSEELIDEIRITTIPILLGEGTSLFGKLDLAQKWKHIKTEVFLDEVVQSWYSKK